MMKRCVLFLFIVLATLSAAAKEQFSYLYIQGDKQTPFYLKLDGAMQPRYGKNYCILPQLAPGPLTIEILFQQNSYPSEKFTVLIPDGGSRGFLLVKKEDAYELYDLQQGFYLKAGNAADEDHMPTVLAVHSFQEPPLPTKKTITEKQPLKNTTSRQGRLSIFSKKDHPEQKVKPVKKLPAKTNHTASEGPAFIPNMELGHDDDDKRIPPEPERQMPIRDSVMIIQNSSLRNSDCPNALSNEDFGKVFHAMSSRIGDEQRLAYILGQMDKCYQSWQARSLAQILETESARFTLLKHIYPRISDQSSFALLDDLFSTDTWKSAFSKLLHP
ncbi:MAG: DUF4476 domain-containing protein [Bacteroidetes bacterium]|nr:DUF4476 domain-containing protein [Bacteroidota bacterium]MBS1629501.1 DUF4476 domain-containing protein [Bacteroidota bacterium]